MSALVVREISRTDPTFAEELLHIDALLMRAYQSPSRASRVERFLALEDRAWGVVTQGDDLVSAGGYIAYPDGGFGWIGLIATNPDHRGKGGAQLITSWAMEKLRSQNCGSVLDGSTAGAPVYTRMGYTDHGWTRMLITPDVLPAELFEAEPNMQTVRVDVGDLPEIVQFDAPLFGANRAALLTRIFNEHPKGFVCRDATGNIVGYAFRQEQSLGPFVAASTSALHQILVHALRDQAPLRLNVPAESQHLPALMRLGCREFRALRHMHHGIGPLPGNRSLLVTQSSFGEG